MRSRTRPDPAYWADGPDERLIGLGQGIVEYGLILGLSALLTVVLLVFFGGTLSVVLQAVGDAIDAAS
jgi:Flp pilus assembly pilin Flp